MKTFPKLCHSDKIVKIPHVFSTIVQILNDTQSSAEE